MKMNDLMKNLMQNSNAHFSAVFASSWPSDSALLAGGSANSQASPVLSGTSKVGAIFSAYTANFSKLCSPPINDA